MRHEGLGVDIGLLTQGAVTHMPYGARAGKVAAFRFGENVGDKADVFMAVEGCAL